MEDGLEESERLTSPSNLRTAREKEEEDAREEDGEKTEEEKMGDEEKKKKEDISKVAEEEGDEEKREEEGKRADDNGGILRSLITNLPPVTVTPALPLIPENASPATEEASILIAIIHD